MFPSPGTGRKERTSGQRWRKYHDLNAPGFPDGTVDKSTNNIRGFDSIPGPGRPHLPWKHVSACATTAEPACLLAHPGQLLHNREATAMKLTSRTAKGGPCSLKLEIPHAAAAQMDLGRHSEVRQRRRKKRMTSAMLESGKKLIQTNLQNKRLADLERNLGLPKRSDSAGVWEGWWPPCCIRILTGPTVEHRGLEERVWGEWTCVSLWLILSYFLAPGNYHAIANQLYPKYKIKI